MASEIRIIVLDVGHLDKVVRRYEKGWVVRFVCGPTLLGSKVVLRTSLTGYDPLKWTEGVDQTSVHCDVKCEIAGSFRYTFSLNEENECKGSGYFLVMPSLTINNVVLPNGGVVCQTYLTKLLGEFPEWEKRLALAVQTGYNMIHLTPIHRLGVSNSSYSIADHHALIETIHTKDHKFSFDDVQNIVNKLEKEWNVLTAQDVVWNHAAKNAEWLQEHPESSYNCLNNPHMRPAYILDRVYHHFSKEVSHGLWYSKGIPPVVDNHHHIEAIEYVLRTEVLPKVRMHEFFQIDVEKHVSLFREKCAGGPIKELSPSQEIKRIQDPEWRRFGCTVDWKNAIAFYNRERSDSGSEGERIDKCAADFRLHLEKLNEEGGKYGWNVAMEGLGAVMGHITYERCADHGPRKGKVCDDAPLTTDYFLHLSASSSWEEDEKLAYDQNSAKYLMAFNGWVMSSNVLENFALKTSEVYLRRQLVCWGDSVKLNYGDKPEDSPFLWSYMKEYTESCAKIFHGVRIDNAHGTPIHVAEYLLKAAREVRPDIYVFAELFTGSEDLDNMFVNRLGISALIREAQSAHDSHEQGRLVYRYSGDCVGAMIQKSIRLAPSVVANGLFLDQTHDNPSPIETRSVYDLLPTAAMVAMATCATGSTRGYDELVPYAIHVVSEKRPYSYYDNKDLKNVGIVSARKILNDLHVTLAKENYSQVFVDQMNEDIVAVTRHNPVTHSTVIVVSHTIFNKFARKDGAHVKQIPLGGVLEEILFEMNLVENHNSPYNDSSESIKGLDNYQINIREHVPSSESQMIRAQGDNLEITNFPSGSVVGFKIRLHENQQNAIKQIRDVLSGSSNNELKDALKDINLQDFNHLLFCCHEEDKANIGFNPYDIPNFGSFVYGGLQGIITVLKKIRENNDLGHPLCGNLRDGLWLVDFIINRLKAYKGLQKIAAVFERCLSNLQNIPYYLRPTYFESLISYLYSRIRESLLEKINSPSLNSSSVVRMLSLSSISFVGYVPGAGLAPLPSTFGDKSSWLSLSAGLPHFSVGIWRNWGRDTFIALPGCLLLTGRFEDARKIILSFAGCLRHGLIPNLLAEGQGSRYNCRDAVWFWLYSIVKFTELAPNGLSILQDPVLRIYPKDDTEFGKETKEELLIHTMYEALQRHFSGISYRERNAGHRIDEQMSDEGFNVSVWVDKETGFIHGGNRFNCGTWMDKMGSSAKAGNKGIPATPRDGAAVEIQGLAAAVLFNLNKWSESGIIQFKEVKHENLVWTWKDWFTCLQSNFQAQFYISDDCTHEYVNRRGVIKDTVGSSLGYTDFQLRCNFPIALVSFPKIMDPLLSWNALNKAKEVLVGPLGIKTLDPSDWEYNGFYNNSDDGFDKKTAKGWNYHQGPEWVWVAAMYLQARLAIGKVLGGSYLAEAQKEIQQKLGYYYGHLQDSPWSSLPELTQENGIECHDSCHAQAWSVGCLLEVCVMLNNM